MATYTDQDDKTLLTGSSDPEGDAIFVEDVDGAAIATWPHTIAGIGGTPYDMVINEDGTVSFNDNGNTSSNPAAGVSQQIHSGTFTLRDANGNESGQQPYTVTLKGNSAPTFAGGGGFTVQTGGLHTLDPETLFDDVDGHALTFTGAPVPTSGSVAAVGDGTYTYTAPGTAGSYSIAVEVTDPLGATTSGTVPVTVEAAAAGTEQAIDWGSNNSRWLTQSTEPLNPVHTKQTLWAGSFIHPGADGRLLFDIGAGGAVSVPSTGELRIVIYDSANGQNSLDGSWNLAGGQVVAGDRIAFLITTEDDGSGAGNPGILVKMQMKVNAGAWATQFSDPLTRQRLDVKLAAGGFTLGGEHPAAASSGVWAGVQYGFVMCAGGTIPDIAQAAVQDAFVNADGTLNTDRNALLSLVGVQPRIDTRFHDVADFNALVHSGAAAFDGKGVDWV